MKKIVLSILVLGLMAVAAPTMAAEWYIDTTNGNDATADGSSSNPYQSFHAVDSSISGGDTVYIKGTLNESIILGALKSGTDADHLTTITNWPGFEAVVSNSDHIFNIAGFNYGLISGLTITNNNTATKNGIRLMNGVNNVTISDCVFRDIGYRAINTGGGNSNITIENNTIYDIQQNGINIGSGNSNFVVTGNTIYNTGLGDGNGTAILSGSDVSITNNKIYNNAVAIFITGETAAIDTLNISNNFIYGSSSTSMTFQGQVDYANIYNNTFYEESISQIIVIDSAYSGTALEIKNNIFVNTNSAGEIYYIAADINSLISDYNLFYAPNFPNLTLFYKNGVSYLFSEWQAQGYDANSINVDPRLVSTSDLHVLADSPAIDAGTTLASITDDYDGEARIWGSGYDIGADEVAYLDVPANLTNTSRGTYIATLGWDEVSNAQSYNIRYRTSNSDEYTTTISDVNSVNLTGLINAGKYYWQVQAVNEDIVSDWSAEKRLITYPRKVKKGEIKITDIEATKARIRINSMASRINGFNIIVAKKTGNKYKKVKTVKVSNKSNKTYTYRWIEDLNPNTRYRIRVKARRAIGSTKYLSSATVSKYLTTLSE